MAASGSTILFKQAHICLVAMLAENYNDGKLLENFRVAGMVLQGIGY